MDLSLNENKKIVIWGAGQSGVKTLELLEHYGVEIHAFLDSSPEKIGVSIRRLPVFSPEILNTSPLWNNFHCTIFIASLNSSRQIAQYLETAGWREGIDYFTVPQSILSYNFFPLFPNPQSDASEHINEFIKTLFAELPPQKHPSNEEQNQFASQIHTLSRLIESHEARLKLLERKLSNYSISYYDDRFPLDRETPYKIKINQVDLADYEQNYFLQHKLFICILIALLTFQPIGLMGNI